MSFLGLSSWWSKVSGERSSSKSRYITPTFLQHQKMYQYVSQKVKGLSVIDVGCGTGEGDIELAKNAASVLGIDRDLASIEHANKYFKRPNLKYKCLDLMNISLNSKFDMTLSFQVIEHLIHVDEYLLLLGKITKTKGKVIISTPNSITQSYNENPFHIHEFTINELQHVLLKHFTKVKILGLFGDKNLLYYEKIRKHNINKIFSLDCFNLRRFIPRQVKMLLFSLLVFVVRKDIDSQQISISSYRIGKYQDDCIDLIAICEK